MRLKRSAREPANPTPPDQKVLLLAQDKHVPAALPADGKTSNLLWSHEFLFGRFDAVVLEAPPPAFVVRWRQGLVDEGHAIYYEMHTTKQIKRTQDFFRIPEGTDRGNARRIL